MDSTNLSKLLEALTRNTNCYSAGVFPLDLIPKSFTHFPICFIANTDPSYLPGQHWVAYYFTSPTDYEFFDSYGLHPSLYSMPYTSPTHFNTVPLQSLKSAVCGQFCLYFLETRCRGVKFPNFLHSFSRCNLLWNDRLVRKFVQRIRYPKTFYSNLSNHFQISNSFFIFRKHLKH